MSFFPIDTERTSTALEDGNPGASSLFRATGKYLVEYDVQNETTVPVTRLSTFMSEFDVSDIDLLWMDIQGAELLALQGLGDCAARVGLIHVELEFVEIYQGQPLYRDVKRFLNSRGFRLVRFTDFWRYSCDAVFFNVSDCRKRERAKYYILDRFLPPVIRTKWFLAAVRRKLALGI